MEPLYTYVRGQGWVTKDPNLARLKSGQTVKVEKRLPKEGELWWTVGENSQVDLEYGIAVEDFIRYMEEEYFPLSVLLKRPYNGGRDGVHVYVVTVL